MAELGLTYKSVDRELVTYHLKQFIQCVQSDDFFAYSSDIWGEVMLDSHGLSFPAKVVI